MDYAILVFGPKQRQVGPMYTRDAISPQKPFEFSLFKILHLTLIEINNIPIGYYLCLAKSLYNSRVIFQKQIITLKA